MTSRRGFLGFLLAAPAASIAKPDVSTPPIDPIIEISWSDDGGRTFNRYHRRAQMIERAGLAPSIKLKRVRV